MSNVKQAAPKSLEAADILKDGHPLANPFRKWLEGKGHPATKRQARKFLTQFPQFRTMQKAA